MSLDSWIRLIQYQNANNSVNVTDSPWTRPRETPTEPRPRTDGAVVDTTSAAPCARSRRRRGSRPTRACSTTRRSASGTRCRTRAYQRVQPLSEYVDRRLRLQPGLAEPAQVPPRRRRLDVEAFERAVDASSCAGDRGRLLLVSTPEIDKNARRTASSAWATRTSARC
jgi:hypothetical protein